MLTDNQLVQQLKDDSVAKREAELALLELAKRHTGLYCGIVHQKMAAANSTRRDDMLADRLSNIYTYARQFDPSYNVKFSTFLADKVKFACMSTPTGNKEFVEITENSSVDEKVYQHIEMDDDIELLEERGGRFQKMMYMRKKGHTWEEVGAEFGITCQAAHKFFNKRLRKMRMANKI